MAGPPSLIPDIDFNEVASDVEENYLADVAKYTPRAQVLPRREPTDPVFDGLEIMFGDFGRALGFQGTKKGLEWNLETAADAWTEHPVRSAIEVGINLSGPAFKALQMTRARKLAGVSDAAIKDFRLIDEGVDLAAVPDHIKDIARGQVYNLQRKRNLQDRIDTGLASNNEKIIHWIDKKFGNSYMEAADPANTSEYMRDWVTKFKDKVADNETFRNLMRAAPPDEQGPRIAQYFNDPKKLSAIPEKYQPWAMQMADELRTVQSQAVKEGMIAAEESGKVGPVWFSLVREGTKNTDIGAYTGVLHVGEKGTTTMLRVPKTYSPNLLNRRMTKGEINSFLVRQEAAKLIERGAPDEAIKLLDDKYSDVKNLIKEGDGHGAIKALTADGTVDLTPKSLTVNSLAQQKALLEVYRSVRDTAIKYGKPGADLTPQMKKNWKSLDELHGSDRLRRMVGVAKGLDGPVEELGYVPIKLFNEVNSVIGGPGKGSIIDILDLVTSWHKTVKTALSPGTHGNNIIGNEVFLWNAGVNPLSKGFLDVQRKSWKAIRAMQKGYKQTGGVSELGDLGSLKTNTGKTLSLADELGSAEVQDLVEMSTLLSAEGIGTINRLTEAAAAGSITKGLGKLLQKTTKILPIDKAADIYMAEDGAMKFAYYMTLRQQGLSRQGALLEVGRRMPMYNTIGDTWRGARRSLQPWISFPTEATRILKNNFMDYPLRTSLVMQLPHFAQLGSYGIMKAMGRGQSYQTINDRKNQLPQWGMRPSTIMTPFVDVNGDFRHATMDFLPYTAVMPESIHRDAPIMQKIPVFQEPMPILSGLYYAATGKDAWGREVPSNSLTDKIATTAIQTAGFLAPPLLDKYMFNANDPTAFYRLNQDLGRYPNQFTGKEGDPFFDLFMNSITGLRSYPSSPEQAIINQQFRNKDLNSYKARLTKEASALIKIGDTEAVGEKLADVYQIMLEQYGDPVTTRRKFNDYIKRFTKKNRGAKVFQRMSIEQIERDIDHSGETLAYESGMVRNEHIDALREERSRRRGARSNGETNPLSGLPNLPGLPEIPGL